MLTTEPSVLLSDVFDCACELVSQHLDNLRQITELCERIGLYVGMHDAERYEDPSDLWWDRVDPLIRKLPQAVDFIRVMRAELPSAVSHEVLERWEALEGAILALTPPSFPAPTPVRYTLQVPGEPPRLQLVWNRDEVGVWKRGFEAKLHRAREAISHVERLAALMPVESPDSDRSITSSSEGIRNGYVPGGDGSYVMTWNGERKRVVGPDAQCLYRLIANPGRAFTPAELDGDDADNRQRPHDIDLIDKEGRNQIDARSRKLKSRKESIETQLKEKEAELQEMRDKGEPNPVEVASTIERINELLAEWKKINSELQDIETHSRKTKGLGGRSRTFSNPAGEAARAARQRLARFWKKEFASLPAVVNHLNNNIRKVGEKIQYFDANCTLVTA